MRFPLVQMTRGHFSPVCVNKITTQDMTKRHECLKTWSLLSYFFFLSSLLSFSSSLLLFLRFFLFLPCFNGLFTWIRKIYLFIIILWIRWLLFSLKRRMRASNHSRQHKRKRESKSKREREKFEDGNKVVTLKMNLLSECVLVTLSYSFRKFVFIRFSLLKKCLSVKSLFVSQFDSLAWGFVVKVSNLWERKNWH